MKIVFLIRSLTRGGAQRQVVELAKGLQREGCSVVIATYYPENSFGEELRLEGVRVVTVGKYGRWDIIGFFIRLVRVIRREKSDILHSYLVTSNILAAALKPMLKGVAVVWGVRSSEMDVGRYGWLTRVVYRMESLLARCADLIIANSCAGRAHAVLRGFPKSTSVVIHNGIDTDKFKPDKSARSKMRLEWGRTEEDVLIGMVGRLDPKKDYPTFLRAAAILSKEHRNVHFVCVGEGKGSITKELRVLAASLEIGGRVVWSGCRDDMPAVYAALDVFSLASCYGEGFPNVIGEAMACGVPCVVTDVGDSREIVGDTGIVVPVGDSEALAEGWRALLESGAGAETYRTNCRRRIVENFSVQKLVKSTRNALVKLCE